MKEYIRNLSVMNSESFDNFDNRFVQNQCRTQHWSRDQTIGVSHQSFLHNSVEHG